MSRHNRYNRILIDSRRHKADGATNPSNQDYSSGTPRHHHSLYIDDGNIVIQVENAIFKIHRYFLAKYSPVLRDMLNAPQKDGAIDGTDERPLVIRQDRAVGWELLLHSIYDSYSLEGIRDASGEHMLAILPIAHKYCMDRIESAILDHLKQAHTTETYVDLMVASQIVDSQPLYRQALQGLISSTPKPNVTQAKRIGVKVHHAIMEAALSMATSSASATISSLKAESNLALAAVKAELATVKQELATVKQELATVSNKKCGLCSNIIAECRCIIPGPTYAAPTRWYPEPAYLEPAYPEPAYSGTSLF